MWCDRVWHSSGCFKPVAHAEALIICQCGKKQNHWHLLKTSTISWNGRGHVQAFLIGVAQVGHWLMVGVVWSVIMWTCADILMYAHGHANTCPHTGFGPTQFCLQNPHLLHIYLSNKQIKCKKTETISVLLTYEYRWSWRLQLYGFDDRMALLLSYCCSGPAPTQLFWLSSFRRILWYSSDFFSYCNNPI